MLTISILLPKMKFYENPFSHAPDFTYGQANSQTDVNERISRVLHYFVVNTLNGCSIPPTHKHQCRKEDVLLHKSVCFWVVHYSQKVKEATGLLLPDSQPLTVSGLQLATLIFCISYMLSPSLWLKQTDNTGTLTLYCAASRQ